MRFLIFNCIDKLHIIYTQTSFHQKVSLILFVVDIFMDVHINFQNNWTTAHWDMSDLAILIYNIHPEDDVLDIWFLEVVT